MLLPKHSGTKSNSACTRSLDTRGKHHKVAQERTTAKDKGGLGAEGLLHSVDAHIKDVLGADDGDQRRAGTEGDLRDTHDLSLLHVVSVVGGT